MLIHNRPMGQNEHCYIVAEIGANHDGSYDKARKLIDVAADCGADAAKVQVYRADSLYSRLSAPKEWQVIKDNEVPYEWLPLLRDHAHALGLGFICSAFCRETVTEAAKVADALKLASSDALALELVKMAAKTELPVLVSLGMVPDEEVRYIRRTLEDWNAEYVLLVCNAVYPSNVADIPLGRFWRFSDYGFWFGLSDHTLSTWLPAVAVAMGAVVIEKHLTLDRNAAGPDHAHSLMPGEFAEMVRNIREIETALTICESPTPSEIAADAMQYRRSIHAARDIECGKQFTAEDLIVQRPNDGLPPERLGWLLTQTAGKDYAKGEAIKP